MEFYKYWTATKKSFVDHQGTDQVRTIFGYSNDGLDDALRVARDRARRFSDAWSRREKDSTLDYYPTDSAIREEIIQEFSEAEGPIAVISRNSYGCRVLNTPDVFFADVDIPLPGCLGWLTAKFQRLPNFEQQLIGKIHELVNHDPELGLRMYRTKRGYRIVVTSRTIPASNINSIQLLEQLKADQLYVSLCRSQDCYRARLSPKPWRCGTTRPPGRYPFLTDDKRSQFEKWVRDYELKSADWATCALVGNFGSKRIHPRVASILKLHDHFVLVGRKPLA